MYRFGANKPNGNKTGRTSNQKKGAFAVEPNIEAKYKSKSIPRFTRLYTYNKNKKAAETAKLNETEKPKLKYNQGFKNSYLPRAKSSIGSVGIFKNKPQESQIIKPSSAGSHVSRSSTKFVNAQNYSSSGVNKKLTQYWQSGVEQKHQKLQKSNFTQIRNGAITKTKKSLADDAPHSHAYKNNKSKEKNEFSIIDDMSIQKPKGVVSDSEKDADGEDSGKYMFISPTESNTCDFNEFDNTDPQKQKGRKKLQPKKSLGLQPQKSNHGEDTKKLQPKKSISLKSPKNGQRGKVMQQDVLQANFLDENEGVTSQNNETQKNATNRKSTPNKNSKQSDEEKPTLNRNSRQDASSKTVKSKETTSKLHNNEANKNARPPIKIRNEKIY